ncbi:hypothetical protein RHMOL_Rhmol04G0198000 [Rhododendron molle]|uniref:Uncharacterized protein n=1 Tax=Rhododendron molle TaxID=49168 RepID=A0ACC0P3L3_RHOML|nr:hypothetical protein RHMOL_Rhmol04G0198000 [Rhododendron molle]
MSQLVIMGIVMFLSGNVPHTTAGNLTVTGLSTPRTNLLRIRVVVSMAKAWGKRDAIIESDCQLLIDMLQPNAKQKNWTIQAFLDDISSLSIHSNVVFNWCNRSVLIG